MANQPDPTQQGVRPDRGRASDSPGSQLSSQWLPDIPKVVNWATVLLILSAIPWLLVFADHIFSAPTVVPGADFPASSYGAMLLNIGYLMLAVSVLNGHKWTRITITAGTVLVNFFMLARMAGLGRYLGQVGESEVGTVSFMLLLFAWTSCRVSDSYCSTHLRRTPISPGQRHTRHTSTSRTRAARRDYGWYAWNADRKGAAGVGCRSPVGG